MHVSAIPPATIMHQIAGSLRAKPTLTDSPREVAPDYCAWMPGSSPAFITGGGFHFPVNASDFGA